MAGQGGGTSSKPSDLKPRVFSAIVLAAGAIGSAIIGGWIFALVWGALAVLVYLEWFAMASRDAKVAPRGIHWLSIVGAVLLGCVALTLGGALIAGWSLARLAPGLAGLLVAYTILVWRAGLAHRRWHIGGMIYAGGLLVSVLILRLSDTHGLTAILFLFAIVWGADVGAYFTGRALGGPKLAPRISPNKTWSGFLGGIATGVLAGMLVLGVARLNLPGGIVLVAAAIALVSVAGDLFESHMKRHFGVKDSGHLIPGHGGFMDRLDAFLFASILALIIGVWHGGIHQAGAGLLTGW
ncbi:MAG: phosphatidate cytidylyltransferase [Rhizobiales bacterium]|nr:phosphatidate cytidylyltransferase [Hyphomicrobiales bacterium]